MTVIFLSVVLQSACSFKRLQKMHVFAKHAISGVAYGIPGVCGGGGWGGGEGVHSVLEWVSMCVRKSEKKDNFFGAG